MKMPDEIYVHEQLKNYKMFQNIFFETKGSDKYYHSRVVEALKAENEALKAEALSVHCDFILGGIGSLTDALKENEAMKAELEKRQWQPIESAPKDGTRILVYFKQHGWISCFWGAPEHSSDQTPYIWCIDDFKHGPYAVRGYSDGDDTHWMPLPDAPEVK